MNSDSEESRSLFKTNNAFMTNKYYQTKEEPYKLGKLDKCNRFPNSSHYFPIIQAF